MKFPTKFMTAAVIAGSMALFAGCGSDDEAPLPPVQSAQTGAQGGGGVTDAQTPPTVAALNEMLNEALDPNVPSADKVELVEGAEADPGIFDQLVKAREENPDVSYEIFDPVIPAGPNKATVKVQIVIPDTPPTKLDAGIVFDDGRWKLAQSTVCPLVLGAGLESPMCAAAPAEQPAN